LIGRITATVSARRAAAQYRPVDGIGRPRPLVVQQEDDVNGQRALWVGTSESTRGGIATFVRTMRDTPLWDEWNIEHIATHRNGSIPARIARFAVGLTQFLARMIRRRPDVVHIHTASYGSFTRKATLFWIARGFGVPVVLHVHGGEFTLFYKRARRPVQRLIESTLRNAHVVVALGRSWADQLTEIAPTARVVIVANSIRPATPVDQRPGAAGVHVVFLGDVSDAKGTFTLIEAWARIVAAVHGDARSVRLTIAGDGEVARARARVGELGVETSIDVRGWIGPDDVAALLDSAHILVLPSRNEGQPMAILEAMARGLCVVASDVGGVGDLLDSTSGALIHPDDVEELTSALLSVLTDDDARARFGAAAYRRVRESFDVAVVSKRFDELYRDVSGAGAVNLPDTAGPS
jgi:glycosyltransferase involved in cell wall biosynthesis